MAELRSGSRRLFLASVPSFPPPPPVSCFQPYSGCQKNCLSCQWVGLLHKRCLFNGDVSAKLAASLSQGRRGSVGLSMRAQPRIFTHDLRSNEAPPGISTENPVLLAVCPLSSDAARSSIVHCADCRRRSERLATVWLHLRRRDISLDDAPQGTRVV